MCGIAGYVGNTFSPDHCLSEMINAINHRGPDSNGIWFDANTGVGLAHARLSILDLTSAGHQPMLSTSRDFVMIFNGEIYNHTDLRKELDSIKKRNWLGHSDTETLLLAIEQWGLDQTLKKTVGMFAIALWDKRDASLHLACDRIGEKPIYYGMVDGQFVFASELKSIKKFPNFSNSIDRSSVALFLRYNSIPAPYSIYEDIFKLEPGHVLRFDTKKNKYCNYQYWSTNDIFEKGKKNHFIGSAEDAVDQLETILSKAVSYHMQ
jgi:asparagine synthase (glutamine-hydrolysing)